MDLNRKRNLQATIPEDSKTLCSVCYVKHGHFLSQNHCDGCKNNSSLPICTDCLRQYVITTCQKDFSKEVKCPDPLCKAPLNLQVVREALVTGGHQSIWSSHIERRNWTGTAKEWIKCFAALCPGCNAPIEKNGGCDNVVCSRCHQRFLWSRAKQSAFYRFRTRYSKSFSLTHQKTVVSKINMNPFGVNPYSGPVPQFVGGYAAPSQSVPPFYGAYPNQVGYNNSMPPFPGANYFPNPPPAYPPTGFAPAPVGGPYNAGFGYGTPSGAPNFGYPGPGPFVGPFQGGIAPPFIQPMHPSNAFASNNYGRSRRHRSSRHHSRTSSSSSDESDSRNRAHRNRRAPAYNNNSHPAGGAPPARSPRTGSPVQ